MGGVNAQSVITQADPVAHGSVVILPRLAAFSRTRSSEGHATAGNRAANASERST